jgi:signal transduction histidine kinase
MSLNPTARQPENAVSGDREERMKRFLATASHDLQSPLRHITMYAEMLLDDLGGTLDGEQIQGLKMIMEKAQAAQRLTKALMGLAGGRPQVTMGAVDLQPLAEEAWRALTEEMNLHDATLALETLPAVRTDATLLSIALRQLFANALTYRSAAAPRVSVSAIQEAGHWLIRIADNGTGIEPAHQDRIFEPFWKLPKPDTVPGPGLGLTTARDVLTALGGELRLEHSDENGSRFVIRLPA